MNKDEFSSRVMSLKKRMYHIACSYLQGDHDRLDAISEAVLKAWQKRTSLKNEDYFDTWLIRILIRECINIQRKHKWVFPMQELPEKEVLPAENLDLQWAVDALPQKLRAVVVLYYLEGYSVDDVTQILRLPKGSVCSRLSRARTSLREFLEEGME